MQAVGKRHRQGSRAGENPNQDEGKDAQQTQECATGIRLNVEGAERLAVLFDGLCVEEATAAVAELAGPGKLGEVVGDDGFAEMGEDCAGGGGFVLRNSTREGGEAGADDEGFGDESEENEGQSRAESMVTDE